MTIRCKFVCESVTSVANWDLNKGLLYTTRFKAVYGGSPENDAFFAATPSGVLEVGIHKDDAFVPGKEYYIDITAADEVRECGCAA